MSLESAIANRAALLSTVGKNMLNIMYPDEFELYVLGLELIDETGKTLRYFVFPINPSSMREMEPQATNIKKTLAGVTVISTPTFIPTEINLSGNFGRQFKVLLGDNYVDFISSFQDGSGNVNSSSILNGIGNFFDTRVKTGYGCCKVLEDIINQSNQIGDDGLLRKLILHNPAIGNSYVVKATSLEFNMSEQSNMIWNYSLALKSIAPLSSLMSAKDLQSDRTTLSVTGFIQNRVNTLLNSINTLL